MRHLTNRCLLESIHQNMVRVLANQEKENMLGQALAAAAAHANIEIDAMRAAFDTLAAKQAGESLTQAEVDMITALDTHATAQASAEGNIASPPPAPVPDPAGTPPPPPPDSGGP